MENRRLVAANRASEMDFNGEFYGRKVAFSVVGTKKG
jgi:hypothetical protein